MLKKRIAILGSTGSIGANTLDVIRNNPSDFEVVGLTAKSNIDFLEKQIREFKPNIVSVFNDEKAGDLEKRLAGLDVEVCSGTEGAVRVATLPETDMVVSSMVGSAGLIPTIRAIESKKDIAFANKEILVMAGEIITEKVKKGGNLIPIDSEHSAIFQSLVGDKGNHIRRLILTASGGPFASIPVSELKNVSVKEALQHPRWEMGKKVSIDSATMMNKGLEVIEAKWLFGVDVEKIEVLIHPQSIIHSIVEFTDGSHIAQLSSPDMRIPISYALNYPRRLKNELPSLDLAEIGELTFFRPDPEKFICLSYAYEAIKKGGTMPAVLNASNEIAVQAFLKEDIGFLDISRLIRKTMDHHKVQEINTLEDVLGADEWAREKAKGFAEELKRERKKSSSFISLPEKNLKMGRNP